MVQYLKRQCLLRNVVPGSELGSALLSEAGRVVLEEGTIVTENVLKILENWGISRIEIREEVPETAEELLSDKEAASAGIQTGFYHEYTKTVNAIKHCFESMRFFHEVPISEMRELVDKSIDPIVDTVGVINQLYLIRRWSEYTFHHSVNVAVMAGVLGKWLGYSGIALKDLILAGLLHDIGKSQIPLEILNKPSKLTTEEMNVMKSHCRYGFNMVKDIRCISLGVAYGILQHHERLDGGGYPGNLSSEEIHQYPRIIAVADIYDAMTSERVYHAKDTPFTVVEMINKEAFGKLDPEICTVFLNNVRDYFLGNIVKLSDGSKAEVVFLGQYQNARPVVRTQNGEFIDLERRKDISIVDLCAG